MSVYRKLCYGVEDLFVKMLTKKQDSSVTSQKVQEFRTSKERNLAQKKQNKREQAEQMR
ncbi:MAG: hypothetical protein ACQEWW_26955 [Bacillota bacterium]